MEKKVILCAGKTQASRYAFTYLKEHGYAVTDSPGKQVTHLLLDVPSFEPSGQLRMGGDPQQLLQELPENTVVYGGNIATHIPDSYRKFDFLQDPFYLSQNAWLTAECALDVALPYLTTSLRGCPVLILGWGRIGKSLSKIFSSLQADVTVATRKISELAMLGALGYRSLPISDVPNHLHRFRLILNTVPAPILNREAMGHCRDDCIRIELASVNGMDDPDAVIARGLPGIHLPESSGQLIAETFLRYDREESI